MRKPDFLLLNELIILSVLSTVEIFDILFDSYEFTPHEAEIVLEFKGNILEQVYDEWLKSDNGIREDVEQSIDKTFVLLGQVVARYAS